MKRTYSLTIVYDTDTDTIEFIDEGIVEDRPSFEIGGVDIEDYFDEDTMKLIRESYTLGES